MGYFASLIVISWAASLACLLIPDESSPSGRMLRLAASLCVLALALSPIAKAKERFGELVGSFEAYVESIAGAESAESAGGTEGAIAQEVSRQLAALVCERFDLDQSRVKVAVMLDTSDEFAPTLTHVRVSVIGTDTTLSPSAGTPDPKELSAYITELTGVGAEAVILAPGTP